ncbi:LuxR C-terminal-related transcriptional regulator [Lentzea sp. BCCO 10_0856]|uniref:LuxR C-terminal-related transcriptional regulator n=1 Tax=Lentzea miocenica TaxID=3095431 RepID=A0ABU4T3S1_9PSEU|nr:AAA family ATPase [Lentzea sp. BCCO 10_0856]MDX8032622.1 LuxR C-terminal-related transcriptional regulator [Lentzea sp. BCCO 10_0856]
MARPSLIGRDDDLTALHAFVHRALTGTSALVLAGDPGVGKTALLDAAAGHAASLGMRILPMSGAEFEAELAFAGLHQLVSTLPGAEVASPLAVALGMAEGPPPGRSEVVDAVAALLSAAQPLLVTVDDLHWLDRPSAMVLDEVAQRQLGRVGLLFAMRGEQAGHVAGAEVRVVRPLSDDAAGRLLEARYPAMTSAVRRRLLDDARGNPLALLELPAALTSASPQVGDTVPERLREVFAARVSALPDATRQALLLAALESPAPLELFESARDLAPAERLGLVDLTGDAVVFRHPLTRSAVVAVSTADDRRHAHTVLAERMRDRPDRHAWHLAQTAAEPDEQIALLLEDAALHARKRGDTAGAVSALIRAAELSGSINARGRRLADAAYIGALADGQLRRVPELLEEVRTGDELPSLEIAVAAAHYLLFSGEGDIDTAHRLLVGALEMQKFDEPDDTITDAVITLGWVCYFGGGPRWWEAFHHVTSRMGELPPLVERLRAFCADPARTALSTLDELDRVIAGWDDHVPPVDLVRTGLTGVFVDRLAACREPLLRLRARPGLPATAELHTLSLLALERLAASAWDEAVEFADEHVRLADAHGYSLLRCLGLYPRAMVAAGRGDDRAVTELTNRIIGWAAPRGATMLSTLAAQALSLAAIGRGDHESAYRHASSVSPAGELASHVPAAPLFVLDLVESALRLGLRDEAVAHVKAARAARLEEISPRYVLLVGAAEALCTSAPFEDVLEHPGVEAWPFEHARVLLLHGEQLRRARKNQLARVQLARAQKIFAGLGAGIWVARVERELRPADAHRPGGELTAQQLTIVRMAAEGLTNKEIAQRLNLSARTVATHLYQVFPKLGVSSRAGLRDALERLDRT